MLQHGGRLVIGGGRSWAPGASLAVRVGRWWFGEGMALCGELAGGLTAAVLGLVLVRGGFID